MAPRVLIVGQGLAGTALGLELEEAGLDFTIVSAGHADAASRVAAGLVNPVTGMRWVKSERVEELLPWAEASFRRWGGRLGVELWHPLHLTRVWRDAAERAAVEAKIRRGELAPYAGAVTERGMQVAGAAWVDLPALLAAAADRWRAGGIWRSGRVEAAGLRRVGPRAWEWSDERYDAVVMCGGFGPLVREIFADEPLALARGEMLTVRGSPLPADVGLSGGGWVLGGADGGARVGATYDRGRDDLETTVAARERLLANAERLVGGTLEVTGQSAGVRLTTPDRLPLAGWHPREAAVGILGALGSKGSLWAPWLARIWREVLTRERPHFPPATSPGRFPPPRGR